MREFIVEADGGSRGNPGPAGYGAVVTDAATGEILAEEAEYLGVVTNNVAEYRGLVAGLRAAHALDPAAVVHVRMDSKLVIEQMSGRWKIKHPDMKPLAAQARSVFPPDQVTYEWIPRERNKHADRLANEAMDAGAKGEAWSPATSRAALDAPPAVPEPSGPPGDAAAGAAKARAALAGAAATAAVGGESAAAAGSRAAGAAPVPQEAAPQGEQSRSALDDRHPAGTGGQAAPGEPRVSAPGWSSAPDLGAPATFVLLRHGETHLTPQKRFSGSGGTDPALSEAGREQARRVGEALARRGTVQAVVASPLARTRETAGIVAARLGLEVTVEDGLRETDFGAWEGLTFGEVRERHPDDLNAWLADPEAHPTGGGESFAETATRVAATRDKLVAAYAGRTVLLVSHVTPIKTFVRLALGAPPESLFRMELSAASLSAVAYYADGNASVRLFNDTSHLRP
ncbi:bifunctional RNase H/acid phosphatase [Streptomyces sp. FXJ1.172]|uniref:bifunctional RNase H/acid phosphatase n=1 Tax=Streptomyces sp. FXJ1.172 TaxID=710705 RepID=UPI0007D039DF|nr:bifunctional RNase H/acid phosphatase [Streptomyces sp. FXJ1.172]WEO97731.1 bifunctional RNase H/acid phosphatase [Streptomyces sp. FXJ1.172]